MLYVFVQIKKYCRQVESKLDTIWVFVVFKRILQSSKLQQLNVVHRALMQLSKYNQSLVNNIPANNAVQSPQTVYVVTHLTAIKLIGSIRLILKQNSI